MLQPSVNKAISDAIVKILTDHGKPLSTREVERELTGQEAFKGVRWEKIRNNIWDLTASQRAFLTWDWKLSIKPGPVEPPGR